MHIQSLSGKWRFRQVGAEEWLSATVPGSVHTDLLAADRIPDPFVADNEQRVQWVAECDWEYSYSFTVAPALLNEDLLWLICDGLDTVATVSLNGHILGHSENMFRQVHWDVKPFLRTFDAAGKPLVNELQIRFSSPVRFAAAQQAMRALPGAREAIPGGPYVRKAPYQFGWDWGPQLPAIGIWKPIRLEAYSDARLEEVHLRQHHADGQVTIEARVVVKRASDVPLVAEVRITAPDGEVLTGSAAIGVPRGTGPRISPVSEATVQIPIIRPQLWWPNGYGQQPLYQVEVAVRRSAAADGSALDRRSYPIGLRTVELRQAEDAWGRSFTFVVNGVPIFAKGSNWAPADSFPTRITAEHLEGLIRAAAETHQNMLRV